VNATAPEPVRNATFARELGQALHRPALLRLPALPLRLALGDLADELLLGGQRVVPEKALKSGFAFRHDTLRGALADMLGLSARGERPQPARSMMPLAADK
jgi:NAD dependent epimerase/dehydratase family enzyme